ncbi:MAG TPA: AbrB/MazE/SpoVT family DNA-binding domain-containing protein [Candidatus Nanoarchaeia archaeon]|nr:AbrB/MazE/SpoVT family DNA-binding domain-containing protein [Candidatus Nanoarchaeia archaeon]
MITKTTLKSWGSSLGVVVPKEVVNAEHLHEGEEVILEIRKKHSLQEIFGSLKDWKIDSQKMKDESRKEWAK